MSFRSDAVKNTLQYAFDLFKENERISALLDDKAQKVGALAGVFLAAGFGFLNPANASALLATFGSNGKFVLIPVIGSFVLSIGACLWVMWVKSRPTALKLAAFQNIQLDLSKLRVQDVDEEIELGYYNELLELWVPILAEQTEINQAKGTRLKISQFFVSTGMLFVAGLLVAILFRN